MMTRLPLHPLVPARSIGLRSLKIGDRLFFARKATDPDNPSTVPGSLASGRRVAAAIVERVEPGEAVVIVGAGVAGLAAARDLTEAGFGRGRPRSA